MNIMLRWARRIAIFLLLGAIVNVAIAWGFALTQDAADAASDEFLYSHVDEPRWCFITVRDSGSEFIVASRFPFADVGWKYVPLAVPSWSMIAEKPIVRPELDHKMWFEAARGWPWLSMAGHLQLREDWEMIEESHWAIPLDTPKPLFLGGRFLPLRPLWPGFVVNTILYAVVLWMALAGSVALRRWRRIGRKRCPACGYPRGTSPVCTECGEPLPSDRPR